MRIAVLNKAGMFSGGAGKMAMALCDWMSDAGHDVKPIVVESFGAPDAEVARTRVTRLGKSIEVRTLMNEAIPFDYLALKRRVDDFRPDVVHVHDISRAFSVDTIRLLSHRYPMVWTCHDQSAMTGGCISPVPCERFNTGCGSCPKRGSWNLQGPTDLTHWAWERRRRLQAEGRVVMAAPSEWAAARLSASPVFAGRDVSVVHNAIEPSHIRHRTVASARQRLGIPQDRFVIVVISHDLTDVTKNPPSQQDALRAVADLDPLVVLMGNSSAVYESALAPVETRALGFIADERTRRLVYAAGDMFLNSSLSDTFSLTTLESLAAGTPVVAYASGGIPEILDDSCGVLVEPDNGEALAAAIRAVAKRGVDAGWRRAARDRARHFSPDRHVAEYLALYDIARSTFQARR